MENNKGGKGLSFTSVLTLIFITLKLTGHIDWKWHLVLMPTIISVAFLVIIIIVASVISVMNK